MKRLKPLIICDLSDVLIRGLEGSEKAISVKLGLAEEDVAAKLFNYDYRSLWYGTVSELDFFQKLISDFEWDISTEDLTSIIHNNFTMIEGTYEVYRELKSKQSTVLYTVNCSEWFKHMAATFDLNDLFDRHYFSYTLKSHKKEPEGFKKIMADFPDHDYYLIDDSDSNIRMAESLGINPIKFLNASRLRRQLQEAKLL